MVVYNYWTLDQGKNLIAIFGGCLRDDFIEYIYPSTLIINPSLINSTVKTGHYRGDKCKH